MEIKNKVLKVLKPAIAKKGFSAKTIEGLADNIVKNLEEDASDEDIEAEIQAIMPYADLMQSENTRYANEIKKQASKKPVTKGVETEDNEPETVLNPEVPEWAKSLLESNKTLTAELSSLKQEKVSNSLVDTFKTKGKSKGIDEKYLETQLIGRKFNTEEEVDELVEQIGTAYEEYSKTVSNSSSTGRPFSGTGGNSNPSSTKKGAEMLDSWANSNKPLGSAQEEK